MGRLRWRFQRTDRLVGYGDRSKAMSIPADSLASGPNFVMSAKLCSVGSFDLTLRLALTSEAKLGSSLGPWKERGKRSFGFVFGLKQLSRRFESSSSAMHIVPTPFLFQLPFQERRNPTVPVGSGHEN
jgi:hypothetical protein